MLDFTPVRNIKRYSYAELVADLTMADLRDLTNEMIDYQLNLLANCTDADVVFVPEDPEANDPYAADEADTDLAWNLGHLIVHVTASSEESAALAAEMARGVVRDGRSRSEVPWETVKTIANNAANVWEKAAGCGWPAWICGPMNRIWTTSENA